jgi:RNA polymerase sigma-54 factor
LELLLNMRNAPDLKVSSSFKEMYKGYKESKEKNSDTKNAIIFIKQKMDAAKWFIDAIKQRQQTMMLTMRAILDYQEEFFLTGDEMNLKPMILKDIAELTSLDISTVSRVANSKYVQTEFGTILLKFFFSESMQTTDGDEVSTREIKAILQEIIKAEDKKKPYSDQKLMELLKEKGYEIARRTVAKYREQLNISVARLRKEL